MTAGRGIVHSERTPDGDRSKEAILHGIQTWVALPDEYEETDPWFRHHPATDLPVWEDAGVLFTLIAGEAYDRTSPVQTFSPMIYLDVQLASGKQFTLPGCYSEQAVYSVTEGKSDRRSTSGTTSVGSSNFRHIGKHFCQWQRSLYCGWR